jgi:hypothetical protein
LVAFNNTVYTACNFNALTILGWAQSIYSLEDGY